MKLPAFSPWFMLFFLAAGALLGLVPRAVDHFWPRHSEPAATCWRDPHPERELDFDFYTGIDGKPNRCGYLMAKSILPVVLGKRALAVDLECYPMAPTECPAPKAGE